MGQYPDARDIVRVGICTGLCSSEFQELEAVPTASIVEGPLEPGALASSTLPEIPDEPLERFFSVCPFTLSTSNVITVIKLCVSENKDLRHCLIFVNKVCTLRPVALFSPGVMEGQMG